MYIQVDEDFPQHPKSVRLCNVLGNVVAWAFMVRLWCWAAKYQHDGELAGFEPSEIELAAGWPKADGKFYAAAARVGFIDEDEPGKPGRLHDWMERTGADISRMKTAAERSRTRKKAWRERQGNGDVPRDNGGTESGQERSGDAEERAGNATRQDKTRQDETRQGKARQDTQSGGRAGARSNEEANCWTALQWFDRFKKAWLGATKQLSYGGPAADYRATRDLEDHLALLAVTDRLAAQGRSDAMFAEFLAESGEEIRRARWPWSWFVPRFNGLRIALPGGSPKPRATTPADRTLENIRKVRDEDDAA